MSKENSISPVISFIEKNSVKNQFLNSSLQFFTKPIKTERVILKLVWLILLIISVISNLYYVILNLIDYYNYDLTTSIYTIPELQSEFPTISFCDDNDKFFDMTLINLTINYKDLKSEWKNHIEQYNDSVYGNCYRFNSGRNMLNESIPIKYLKKSGFYDGLIFEIKSNSKIDYSQLLIFIHNHTQTLPTIHNRGVWITPGSENYFVINRVYDEKLGQPYNNCFKNVSKSSFNKTIIDYMKSINYKYTQKECIQSCRSLKSMEKNNCNCSIDNISERFRVKCIDQATDINIKNCSRNFLADFNVEDCTTSYCPLECDSFSYDIQIRSQTIVASGNLSAYFDSSFKSFDEVSKSYYGIYVYFDDLKYTHIKQHPKMEIFGLISNIGGTFSLFLGLSFFSFFEVFEILAEIMFNYKTET